MRKVTLLSTAAVVLLFAAGAASAQELKKDEGPARAPAAQQKAPAEKIAPNMHAGDHKVPETTGQASPKVSTPDKAQALDKSDKSGQPNASVKGTTGSDIKAQSKSNDAAGTTAKSNSPESKSTTGQGAAAGAAKLSTEQRTKITSIIREQKSPPVHLNVSVSVGTRIPANVHLYPVPVEVINVYPDWRGYDYIMVGNEIVIIDPRSHEIVAIIEA